MSVTVTTTKTYTCDLCDGPSVPSDQQLAIQVSSGDGRDVGPGFLQGKITVEKPYSTSNGFACKKCRIALFRRYADELEKSL